MSDFCKCGATLIAGQCSVLGCFRENPITPATADEWERLTGQRPTAVWGCKELSGQAPGYQQNVVGWTRSTTVRADYGSESSRSVTFTTCARCSATIEPAAVEQHHERCFVVGDQVRWDLGPGMWIEGQVTGVAGDTVKGTVLEKSSSMYLWSIGETFERPRDNLRHIQRPGHAAERPGGPFCEGCGAEAAWSALDVTMRCNACRAKRGLPPLANKHGPGGRGVAGPCDADCAKCAVERDAELQDAMERVALPSEDPWEQDPMDVLYDDVTMRELLARSQATARGDGPLWRGFILTPAQRAAVSAHWSAQLRARISAAKERERLSVTYCEVDVDD